MKHNLFVMTILFFGMNLQAEAVRYGSKCQLMSSSTDSTHNGKLITYKQFTGHTPKACGMLTVPCDVKITVMGCNIPQGSDNQNCSTGWQIVRAPGVNTATDEVHFGDVISLEMGDKYLIADQGGRTNLLEAQGNFQNFRIINPDNLFDNGVVQKGKKVVLQAQSNGLCLAGEVDDKLQARTDITRIGDWEKWIPQDAY